MNSLRPSAKATPDATSAPDGSYSSILGFRVLANSPAPSAGVLVSRRSALAVLVTVTEYQSSFPTAIPAELLEKTVSAAAAVVPNAMTAMPDTWPPTPRLPKLNAWAMAVSLLAPLGSTGELMMSNGLRLSNPSAETTRRGSADPRPTVRPLEGPDARTNCPPRTTSLRVLKEPRLKSWSGSRFSSVATLVSAEPARLVSRVAMVTKSSFSLKTTTRSTRTIGPAVPAVPTMRRPLRVPELMSWRVMPVIWLTPLAALFVKVRPLKPTVKEATGEPGTTNSTPLYRMPVPPAAVMKLPSVLKPSVILLPFRMTGPVTVGPVRSKMPVVAPPATWPRAPWLAEMLWAAANESLPSVSKPAFFVTTTL